MGPTELLAAQASEARQTAGLLAAMDAMETTLTLAIALVGEGRNVDLAGLEAEMGRLCAASLAAPTAAVPVVRRRLQNLVTTLDQLRAGLSPP